MLAVKVEALGKWYARGADSPKTLRETLVRGLCGKHPRRKHSLWALRGVDFSVSPGEMLGVMGRNGAGKSTLLQILGGVIRPDEGAVSVRGRIGALLDLGACYHGNLTGRENAMLQAIASGMTRREALQRFPEIVDFAELGACLDDALRTYSTGMQMRLAFSVAVHTEPEVLLVDEFLSVGDLAFQAKCVARITELRRKGCAVVFISHSTDQIKAVCDRALWLSEGRVVALGSAGEIAERYAALVREETLRRTPQLEEGALNRMGSREVEITDVRLLPNGTLSSGQPLVVEIAYRASVPVSQPIFSVAIRRDDGTVCVDLSSGGPGGVLSKVHGEGRLRLHFPRLDLGNGDYFVDVGIYERAWTYAYDYHWSTYCLHVQHSGQNKGILSPPCRWEALPAC